ncbi:hypothetical protein Ahy_B01g053446 [Arachis hypogaea]|uniref:Uncharacterized protein n=1 Tax=Arachis hypogaea TaxID=3818 RepID=A0A445ARY3_ARAHY|nr:hypothetical protein Ahy_B01g053446 [Arachis hypogaea]
MNPYQAHHVSNNEDANAEPVDIYEKEGEELNDFTMSQPTIFKPYDHPAHYFTLNLDAMNKDWSFSQRGSEDDPMHKFEIGQQFENKEELVIAIKLYSIRMVVEYKILESDQLNGSHSCMQTTLGQDHGRLDLKVVADYIHYGKVDPTISIRVL